MRWFKTWDSGNNKFVSLFSSVVDRDGFLYCLEVASGKLLWKVRGSPSPRKAIGNGRLISVWPASREWCEGT